MELDIEIYKGKTFKELCKDIVSNQSHRADQIETLIADLRPMIKTGNDALMIVPLIRQYLDCGIHNDEHLVKLAAIIQRIMIAAAEAEAEGGQYGLSDEEKNALKAEIDAIQKSDSIIVKTIQGSKEEDKED